MPKWSIQLQGRRVGRTVAMCALMVLAGRTWAMGPHQLLVVVNGGDADSVAIAREFAELRGIPPCNVVPLSLPTPLATAAQMSLTEWREQVYVPVMEAVAARGLEPQILAWAYSSGFPYRVVAAGKPPVSLTGATFLRGKLPTAAAIKDGTYRSPLFAGEGIDEARSQPTQGFDAYAEWLRDDMPLPSMMLGVLHPRGNTRAEILACLVRGRYSDGTRPRGTVYLVTGEDVRARCRQWQFPHMIKPIRATGLAVAVVDQLPAGRPDIIGLLMGSAVVDTAAVAPLLPGAIAEHLTSLGAAFEQASQTKSSDWIRAGAVATCGAVTEPYSIPAKFPQARLYEHYGRGCSVIESFYLAIGSPLQVLLLGDPLARPFAAETELAITGLQRRTLRNPRTVSAIVADKTNYRTERLRFLIDGKLVGQGAQLSLDPATLDPGKHRLRVVCQARGLIRWSRFAEQEFSVEKP